MPTGFMPKTLFVAGVVSLTVLACWATATNNPSFAQQPDKKAGEDKWAGKYQEASICMDCHTNPTAANLENKSLDFVLMTEYAIWKTHDKHAQAYAVLEGPRGQAMGKWLGDVRDPKTGCLNCHAMSSQFGVRSLEDIKKKPPDGVSCCGCHGPSQDWVGPHNNPKNPELWRLLPLAEKAKKGFHDLRDPETRATLCLSCHMGNAAEGKVVTHAMYAAGHPPLPPIEIATFSKNEPQHWRDAKDVPLFKNATDQLKAIYHLEEMNFQQTRFALTGSLVALRETMKLARDRATMTASNPQQVWPELLLGLDETTAKNADKLRTLAAQRWPEIALAHSDCYACHHDLKYPSFRQERGFGYQLSTGKVRTAPGRPLLRVWPTALLEAGIGHCSKDQKEHNEKTGELAKKLQRVADACKVKPFGKPEEIAPAAQEGIDWTTEMIAALKQPDRYNKEFVRKLLLHLCRLYDRSATAKGAAPVIPDYEAARQIVSLLDVAYREWQAGAPENAEIKKVLKKLAAQVSLFPYTKRNDRLGVILKVVEKATQERNDEGLKEFSDYLLGDISNQDLLQKLIKNKFLLAIRTGLSNEAFTKGLLAKEVTTDLQRLSNEELQEVLQTIANYAPQTFQADLRSLAKLLESLK